MKKNTVDLISLGCSKNLVDSEILLKKFEKAGFMVTLDDENPKGEIIVINTCGFIQDAKEESIDAILQACLRKKNGLVKKVFVMGCLAERYIKQLEKEIPEVDKFYGKFNWQQIIDELGKIEQTEDNFERKITTPKHYAYLKIAEGCDRHCAFCAIPIITGKHKSRPMEDIIKEVEWLVSEGVKEFQVIEQELTYYGIDIYGKRKIAELISKIADVKGVKWIRLHYAYPKDFPEELLDVIRDKKNVCKYLDIALQHVSDNVLYNMRRNFDKEQTYKLVETIRKKVPGIHIRTTLMVGFPGETEQDFQELCEFVRWAKFERMGAFAYSHEEGTFADKNYKDDVPEEVKKQRLDYLMKIQQQISFEHQANMMDKVIKVIIDRQEGMYYVGRTEFDSPEVDPEVLIPVSERKLRRGAFYFAKVYDYDEFDLYATVID